MNKTTALSLTLSVVLAVLCGCGGGGGSSLTDGTGQIQVSLVDAPLNADEINVDITSVEAHSEEDGWRTIKTFSPALTVNLLDYSTSGASLMLADAPLSSGHYTQIRLMLSGAEVVIGGQAHEVDIQNVTQTGVKAVGEFTVTDGQLVALILDFNAGKSFVNNPKGSTNFMLHPVMTMSPVNLAAEVVGTVAFQDTTGATVAVPEGASVDVYEAGHVGDSTRLISGSLIETDGSFRISVLPQGTYDFQVTVNGASVEQMTGVAVTPPMTDLGTIAVEIATETPQETAP